MSASFVLFTGLEIFISCIIILEIINKKSLIKFEDKLIKLVRLSLKKFLHKRNSIATTSKSDSYAKYHLNKVA